MTVLADLADATTAVLGLALLGYVTRPPRAGR